jgi:hypothetical protein
MTDPTTPIELDSTDDPENLEESTGGAGKPGVGFVGCSRAGRMLRVRVADRSMRRPLRVQCPEPGCGQVHQTNAPMARPLRPDEDAPELAEIPPAEPAGPKRPQRSDADVLAALSTTEWIALPDLAARLGVGRVRSLSERLRLMRRRESPLTTVTAGGKPTLVCRVDGPLPPTPPGYATDDDIRALVGDDWRPVNDLVAAQGVDKVTMQRRLRAMDGFDLEKRGPAGLLYVRRAA